MSEHQQRTTPKRENIRVYASRRGKTSAALLPDVVGPVRVTTNKQATLNGLERRTPRKAGAGEN